MIDFYLEEGCLIETSDHEKKNNIMKSLQENFTTSENNEGLLLTQVSSGSQTGLQLWLQVWLHPIKASGENWYLNGHI